MVRCPFHDDSTPSMSVDLDKQVWFCFGCGIGGGARKLTEKAIEDGILAPDAIPLKQQKPIPSPAIHKHVHQAAQRPPPEFGKIVSVMSASTPYHRLRELAEIIQVDEHALRDMPVIWVEERGAWGFPMRDWQGNIIGIKLRFLDGTKLCVKGSKLGIYYVPSRLKRREFCIVTEGESDCLAAYSVGVQAVGLPSATTGYDEVCRFLVRLQPASVLVVADNDAPGLRAANAILERLKKRNMPCAVWLPPCKDFREWCIRVSATKASIMGIARSLLGHGTLHAPLHY